MFDMYKKLSKMNKRNDFFVNIRKKGITVANCRVDNLKTLCELAMSCADINGTTNLVFEYSHTITSAEIGYDFVKLEVHSYFHTED